MPAETNFGQYSTASDTDAVLVLLSSTQQHSNNWLLRIICCIYQNQANLYMLALKVVTAGACNSHWFWFFKLDHFIYIYIVANSHCLCNSYWLTFCSLTKMYTLTGWAILRLFISLVSRCPMSNCLWFESFKSPINEQIRWIRQTRKSETV